MAKLLCVLYQEMRVVSTFKENSDTLSLCEKYLEPLAARDLCQSYEMGLREGHLQITLNLGMERELKILRYFFLK